MRIIISILLAFLLSHLSPVASAPTELNKRGAPTSAYFLDATKGGDNNKGSYGNFHSYNKGSDPIRGVNLGGWLLLEPWLNTDLFSKTYFSDGNIPGDEFNFCATLGYLKCGSLLETHYSSFITESDFKEIASYGLNAVRIPIGHWAFILEGTDKYYKGSQEKYLQKSLTWAKKYGLKVWIDLHGVPGSQNGYDSSGHKDTHDWAGYNNMDDTKKILRYIFNKYGGTTYKDTVIGIELVNEPLVGDNGVTQDTLSDFYQGAITEIRNTVKSKQNIVLHDGYQSQGAWTGKSYNSGSNLIYDTHLYMLYNDYYKSLDYEGKIKQVCSWGNEISGLNYKEVVGEFTAAFDANSNSVYTKKISEWSNSDKKKISRFVQAEFNAFEKNYGWFFWNWKMGDSDQWDFQVLVKNGVIPNPVSKRTYNDCK